MTEIEKVKKGLDLCLTGEPSACKDCPYDAECGEALSIGPSPLRRDALKLLKEQEPKVVTLDEIKDGEAYWFQRGQMLVTRPVICIHREDDTRKPYITFAWQFGTFSWDSEDYGKTWRCWTAKPTDEQREAAKWHVSN